MGEKENRPEMGVFSRPAPASTGLCQSRLAPTLPSLRDRALRIQANGPGIRLVEPEAGFHQILVSKQKNGRKARLFCLVGLLYCR